MEYTSELLKYSNPKIVKKMAKKYFNTPVEIKQSTRKNKKYMIFDGNKWIHFGQLGYEDFTKHKNKERRKNYLSRSCKIKGNWKSNKFSPNNLSIHLLW